MKAFIRNSLIKFFIFMFAICAAFTIATLPDNSKVMADEPAGFSVIEDASIRNGGEDDSFIGLQFAFRYSEDWINEVNPVAGSIGMLIYPTKNAEAFVNNNSAVDNADAVDGIIYKGLKNFNGYFAASIVFDEDYISSLIEIPTQKKIKSVLEGFYETDFTAIAFAEVEGGSYVYSNEYSTSLLKTAESIASGKTTSFMGVAITDEVKALAETFAGSAIDENVFIVEDGVLLGLTEYGKTLKNIVVPEGITAIADFALCGVDLEAEEFIDMALETIKLPNTLTSIGMGSFAYCLNLTEIVIPSNVEYIGDSAIFGCSSLKNLEVVGNGQTVLNTNMFSNLSLQNLTIGKGVVGIIGMPEYLRDSDCENLYYLGTVDDWAQMAFECGVAGFAENFYVDGQILKEVNITTAKTINDYAFSRLNINTITIGNSVESIGAGAFRNCSSLENIIIPDSVTSIGNDAFSNCSSLKSVVLGNSVESIGSSAFSYCSSLESIIIPASVTSIGGSAFGNCSLLIIYCEAESQPDDWDWSWNSYCPVVWDCNNNDAAEDGYIHVNVDGLSYGIKDGVATVLGQIWNIVTANIKNSVTYKGNAYSVTSIGSYAFYDCSSLTSVVIPDSITSIGDSAFNNCRSLTNIEIPDSVTSIDSYAFSGCDLLQYYVEDNIKYLGNNENPYVYLVGVTSTSINSATIGNGCKVINSYAFSRCSSLESIVIPTSVTSIGDYAFSSCTSLEQVEFGADSKLESIGQGAFCDCWVLKSIVIPKTVTSIGNKAFWWVDGSITIYCEAESKPDGWVSDWCYYYAENTVYWYRDSSPIEEGNYWHYNANGEIEKWVHTHNYDAVVSAPTCYEQGFTTYTCACGDSYIDDYVDATNHNYDAVVTAPTCLEQGYTTYTCGCGDSYIDNYVDPTNHNYGDWVSNGDNTHVKICANDNTHQIIEICATVSTIIKYPSCCETGLQLEICTVCKGTVTTDVAVDSNRHGTTTIVDNYGSQQVIFNPYSIIDGEGNYEPTCTDEGYWHKVCSGCGETLVGELVAKLDHRTENGDTAYTYFKGGSGNVCVDGVFEGYVCSICGDTYDSATDGVIPGLFNVRYTPARGYHTADSSWTYVDGKKPTFTEGATIQGTCTVCQATKTIKVPALSKEVYNYSVVTPAACDSNGLDRYTLVVGNKDGAAGFTVIVDVTTTVNHVLYGEEIDLDKVYSYAEVELLGFYIIGNVPVSCQDKGYATFDCDECMRRLQVSYLGDHSKGIYEVVEPTCQSGGYTIYICDYCGLEYIGNERDAVNCNLVEVSRDMYDSVKYNFVFECKMCKNTKQYLGYIVEHVEDTCKAAGYTKYEVYVDDEIETIIINGTWLEDHKVAGGAILTLSKEYKYSEIKALVYEDLVRIIGNVPVACNQRGEAVFYCEDCGLQYKIFFYDDHDLGEVIVVKPDCLNGGYSYQACKDCGVEFKIEGSETEALGHDYGSPELVDFKFVFTCGDCGDVFSDFPYDIVETEPTCIASGYTDYYFDLNGDKVVAEDEFIRADYVDALGHNYEGSVEISFQVTIDGILYNCKSIFCKKCNEAFITEKVPA